MICVVNVIIYFIEMSCRKSVEHVSSCTNMLVNLPRYVPWMLIFYVCKCIIEWKCYANKVMSLYLWSLSCQCRLINLQMASRKCIYVKYQILDPQLRQNLSLHYFLCDNVQLDNTHTIELMKKHRFVERSLQSRYIITKNTWLHKFMNKQANPATATLITSLFTGLNI